MLQEVLEEVKVQEGIWSIRGRGIHLRSEHIQPREGARSGELLGSLQGVGLPGFLG